MCISMDSIYEDYFFCKNKLKIGFIAVDLTELEEGNNFVIFFTLI